MGVSCASEQKARLTGRFLDGAWFDVLAIQENGARSAIFLALCQHLQNIEGLMCPAELKGEV